MVYIFNHFMSVSEVVASFLHFGLFIFFMTHTICCEKQDRGGYWKCTPLFKFRLLPGSNIVVDLVFCYTEGMLMYHQSHSILHPKLFYEKKKKKDNALVFILRNRMPQLLWSEFYNSSLSVHLTVPISVIFFPRSQRPTQIVANSEYMHLRLLRLS